MSVFYLITIIFGVSYQNVLQKTYMKKTKGNGQYIFSFFDIYFPAFFGGFVSLGIT